jgi:hypothetical protein
VPGLIAASAGSDWSYGGAILTFVFPMILFIAVAAALYVLYTKPQVVPGHPDLTNGRSVSSTSVVSPAPAASPAAEAEQPAEAEPQGPAESAEGK